jgi:hypothetical protein
MAHVKFNITVEAKKVPQGKKTKAHPEVLLYLLAEEHLNRKS